MEDLIVIRNINQNLKNNLIIGLGEKANNSGFPEYYGESIKLIAKLEPAFVTAAVLSSRYQSEETAQIMQISKGTLAQYRSETNRIIRNTVDPDLYNSNRAVVPYYFGLIDIDLFAKVTENLR